MYEQGSFEPVARVVQLASHIEQKRLADIAYETRRFVRIGESEETINQRIQDKSQPLINIYHYHCNHLGTPQELSDDKGDIVWLSYDRAWGGSFETIYKQQYIDDWAISENHLQSIKFQGQSLDVETGLHYNRFRYYDSDVGMFIQRDPIELLGGFNVFAYAPNPIHWIDPFGLAIWHDEGVDFKTWFDKASVEDIENNLKDVKSQSGLRYGGGSHEHFPVSIAPKAKELGFSADELEKLTTPTQNITFSGVKDKEGNILPDSGHHQTRAGRYFHIELIKSLKDATSKEEAMSIMKTLHDKHMKVSNPCNKT